MGIPRDEWTCAHVHRSIFVFFCPSPHWQRQHQRPWVAGFQFPTQNLAKRWSRHRFMRWIMMSQESSSISGWCIYSNLTKPNGLGQLSKLPMFELGHMFESFPARISDIFGYRGMGRNCRFLFNLDFPSFYCWVGSIILTHMQKSDEASCIMYHL